MIPGEIVPGDEPVELNPGRERTVLTVVNTADRPVQVGSHYHFAAVNPGLEFDRKAAWGKRLDVPAGTSVRFEPGVEREVTLVPIAGRRVLSRDDVLPGVPEMIAEVQVEATFPDGTKLVTVHGPIA